MKEENALAGKWIPSMNQLRGGGVGQNLIVNCSVSAMLERGTSGDYFDVPGGESYFYCCRAVALPNSHFYGSASSAAPLGPLVTELPMNESMKLGLCNRWCL